jgi:C4-dicarboxylate-specific signal transduction histidine kinase
VELRQFAMDAMEWMADWRLAQAEKKRELAKEVAPREISDAKAKIESILEQSVPESVRTSVNVLIENYDQARERQIRVLRDDLMLYRSLATAGTTSAVFAHETGRRVTLLKQLANLIAEQTKTLADRLLVQTLATYTRRLVHISDALSSFAAVPIKLLAREKRRQGRVDVAEVITNSIEMFSPFLDDAGIEPEYTGEKDGVYIYGTVALLEAAITNLITNTINAFDREDARLEGRRLFIGTMFVDSSIGIQVADNGPGITELSLTEIWLPGKSSTPGGTGLGLTIVKDSISDLGGRIDVRAHGVHGGAEFTIVLPAL